MPDPMSTTPRPMWFYIEDIYRQTLADPQVIRVVSEDYDRVLHALEAFAALLAVANAAHKNETYSSDSRNSEELNMLLTDLDRLHPGWREWR